MERLTMLFALAAALTITLTASSAAAKKVVPPTFQHKLAPHGSPVVPSPGSDEVLPPEPYPGFFAFERKCMLKMEIKCARQVVLAIFNNESMTNKCCMELVDVGLKCHEGILKAALTLPDLSKVDKEQFKKNDVKTWKHCVNVAKKSKISLAPSPFQVK